MSKLGSDELLRQNVFSSIHMSTEVKTGHVSISYPSCSYCGGIDKKSASNRKVISCYASLYTNSSESFVVWSKKQDEPKGMLWLRSCCVRRGAECTAESTMPIELISKGCRGHCSYTLRFSKRSEAEEWFRSLRLESRKHTIDKEDPFSSSDSGEDNPLDNILSESHGRIEDKLKLPQARRKISSPTLPTRQQTKSPDIKRKKKKSSNNIFQLPFLMDHSLPSISTIYKQDSPTSPGGTDSLGRWSWPVRV